MIVAGSPEWIGAFGTLAAAALAVVIALSNAFRRPSLSLALDRDVSRVENTSYGPLPYIRLRAENGRRRTAAHGVQVVVEYILPLSASEPRRELANVPVSWTHGDASPITLSPGLPRFVDFGCIAVDGHTSSLWVSPAPRDNRHGMSPGDYQIGVAIIANDAPAKRYQVYWSYDGKWRPASEIWAHLTVAVTGA